MPFKPIFNLTPKINKILMEIERVRGFLEAVKLKENWMVNMRKEALIYVRTKGATDPTI